MSICSELWDVINAKPTVVSEEAPKIYRWLSQKTADDFFFDERDFFLGESALLAGGSDRLLGNRIEAESWFDRSDANFRHTVAPAAHLARVSYNRLALRYDMNRHDDVIELLPSTALTFERLGMKVELAKCRFLEAMSLKIKGRVDEATVLLEALVSGEDADLPIRATALLNLGSIYSSNGQPDRAIRAFTQARPILESSRRLAALADMKVMLGETLRAMGKPSEALAAYREAVNDYVELEMSTRVAYVRIFLAEALLEAARPREAEWEILAALPTIQEQKMVPEGLAAIAVLNESVRQRKTDANALLKLRECLQAKS